MSQVETILVKSAKEFRRWLVKNHKTKSHVLVQRYRKHAQHDTPKHIELMHEAIAFGWIDTTAKSIDENITAVNFRKRTKNSRWSNNTLSYAKKLIKENRMSPQGLAAYKLGLQKPTIDHGISKDHPPQKDLIKALSKNKKTLNNFNNLAPSTKFMYIVYIERAKLPETKKRRIKKVVEIMKSLEPKKKKGKF